MTDGKRILITGASGFVGRTVAESCRALGFEVIPTSRSGQYGTIPCDLLDDSEVGKLVELAEPDIVIHCGSMRPQKMNMDLHSDKENLTMAINVSRSAVGLGKAPTLISIGTCAEYGSAPTPYVENSTPNPSTYYGSEKLEITNMLRDMASGTDLSVRIIRPSVIFGEGQADDMFLPSLMKAAANGVVLEATPGEQLRDYIHVDEVCSLILRLIENNEPSSFEIYNCASGKSVSLVELASLIAQVSGKPVSRIVRFGAYDYPPNEVMDYTVSIDKARSTLGWHPEITLEQRLKKLWDYSRSSVVYG